MRLLNVDTFKLEDFFYVDPPPYAILSHTWGSDSEEVSYRDVLDGRLAFDTTRPPKVTGCCKQAKRDGYQYVWIDTCCIDKTNSVELQEAINSMFRWYRDAAICYAYLSDVPFQDRSQAALSSSRWFQRGWTLQELIAPLNLRFYDKVWACMGSKGDLCDAVEAITGIPTSYLLGITELHHASVAQRMSWASKRVTKRQEDIAYCLLGIFGVSMPMIYGEGKRAFRRLQEQIMKDLGDDSILAWHFDQGGLSQDSSEPNTVFGNILAPAPSYFANSGQVVAIEHPSHSSFELHGGSLRLPLTLHTTPTGQVFGLLKCGLDRESGKVVAIPLAAAPGGGNSQYFRLAGQPARLIASPGTGVSARSIQVQLDGGRKSPSQSGDVCWFHIRKSIPGLDIFEVHPAACWHKERALIEVAVGGTQKILVRFQTERKSADFVAALGVDSEARPLFNLMIAAKGTTLEEIASHAEVWSHRYIGTTANNGDINLGIIPEGPPAPSSQRRFVLKPFIINSPDAVPAAFNVTAAMRLSEANALLDRLREVNKGHKEEAKSVEDQISVTKQKLTHQQAEVEQVRAKIAALQQEERRLTEEYNREREAEQGLLDRSAILRTMEMRSRKRIVDLEEFIDVYGTYTARKKDPEKGVALPKAAERVVPLAIENGYDSLSRMLIEQAANVTASDIDGSTPLAHAVRRRNEELVRLLIDKGADVASSGVFGVTPLHIAVELGLEDIARLLIDKGADACATTCGTPPLHVAVQHGFEGIARLLLENGASVIAQDDKGDTPLGLCPETDDRLRRLLNEYAVKGIPWIPPIVLAQTVETEPEAPRGKVVKLKDTDSLDEKEKELPLTSPHGKPRTRSRIFGDFLRPKR